MKLKQANELRRSGRLLEAELICRELLVSQPDHAPANHLLGMIVFQLGRRSEGLELLRRSTNAAPGNPYIRCNLAGLLIAMNMDAEAVVHLEEVLRHHPGFSQAMVNLGIALERLQRSREAVSMLSQAIREVPEQLVVHKDLAVSLLNIGEIDKAEALCRRALQNWQDSPDLHCVLGSILMEQNQVAGAIDCFTRAIELDPRRADAHTNFGMALLAQGQWERGWQQFEWRRRFKPELHRPGRSWNGEDLSGKTILVYAEGGFGNTIQFVRYIPILAARGARVILQCNARLIPLLESLSGVSEFLSRGAAARYHYHCPLMSLPAVLSRQGELDHFSGPYLFVSEGRAMHWRNRLSPLTGMRIGICWQGEQQLVRRRNRSIPFEAFATLATRERTLVSLQREAATPTVPWIFEIPELDKDGAFIDTVAVMRNLDLVVTCDTSIAHLAGAIGIPVAVALPYAADWRWQIDRQDTPWYPSMRLWRLGRDETWAALFDKIGRNLNWFAHAK